MPAAGAVRLVPEPDPLDDVVARARRGDDRGFEALWVALHPSLIRYLGVIASPAQAEDLASETWTQVIRDLGRFDGDGRAFKAWLFTVGRHRVLDASRYRGRLRRKAQAEPGRPVSRSAEADANERFATRGALALVAELPRRQAEAVALRVVAGLDSAAAAEIAGTSVGALRVNLHRGLQALAADPRLQALEEHS